MSRTKDLGMIGRLHIYSDINSERETPSSQVWVEFMKDGKVFGTASGNCTLETGEIECDNGKAYALTTREWSKLELCMEENEGIPEPILASRTPECLQEDHLTTREEEGA